MKSKTVQLIILDVVTAFFMPAYMLFVFYGWWHWINPIWDVKGGNDFIWMLILLLLVLLLVALVFGPLLVTIWVNARYFRKRARNGGKDTVWIVLITLAAYIEAWYFGNHYLWKVIETVQNDYVWTWW